MSDQNIRKLFSLYFADWLYDAGDHNILSLGNAFDERISDILAFKNKVFKELDSLHERGLSRLVSASDEALGETERSAKLEDDKKFRELGKIAPAEVKNWRNQDFTLWALNLRPKVLADYKYWGKFDRYLIDELVWLSTGLPPQTSDSVRRLSEASRTHVFPLAEVDRRRMLILRAFPMARKGHVDALEFRAWAIQVEFEAHAGFYDMLESVSRRIVRKIDDPPTVNPEAGSVKHMQPRELRTAAKIITAMAIDVYGHVPNQKRSKTTKDILDACDKAGLSVSNDTILKYLRAGEEQMDD